MGRLFYLLIFVIVICQHTLGQEFMTIQEAFSRSYSYENEGKYEEACSELMKIYDDNSFELNLRLGWLNYNSGSFLESIEYYQKAIELKPFAIESRFGIISPASETGNYTLVEEQYNKILAIDPMNTKANYWLGYMFYSREQYDQALKYLEKVVNLYPFDYDATILFAWTNFRMQNLREAKLLFQQALLIKPGDSSATEGLNLIQ